MRPTVDALVVVGESAGLDVVGPGRVGRSNRRAASHGVPTRLSSGALRQRLTPCVRLKASGVRELSGRLRGKVYMKLLIALAVLLLMSDPASAQIHVSKPIPRSRVVVPAKASTLKPLDCKAMAANYREPWMQQICEKSSYDFGTLYAKTYGMPRPSKEVVALPAHGSAAAKTYGIACMGQLAMRRLKNGWEQLRDSEGNYLRCRDL